MAYATAAELKFELQADNDTFDTFDDLYDTLVTEASEAIDQYCRRTFVVPGSATVRYFFPTIGGDELYGLPDIASESDLVIAHDSANNGLYTTTLTAATDYVAYTNPLGMITNLVSVNGFGLRASRRPPYKVTARFGWPSVPGPVHRACIILARRYFTRKDSPSGVLGFGDLGAVKLSVVDPDVQALLGSYRDISRLIG